MNHQQAIGYLIAGHINHAFFALEDEDIRGCCPVCCGPCAALAWYRDNATAEADTAVASIIGNYDWQTPDIHGIDWTKVNACWANGCPNAEWHDELAQP